jgi:polysaccharide export outer membrane protein
MFSVCGNAFRGCVIAVLPAIIVAFGAARAIAAPEAPPQGTAGGTPKEATTAATPARPTIEVPAEYVIGADDVLGIVFWRDPDMTGDVTVRPDGKVTLPLIGDITAIGLTPEALRDVIQTTASKYQKEPSVTVVVRQINSRKVFITGEVTTPGAYPLSGPRTVMQLIALAGGLTEFADKKNITINRVENGTPRALKFNYAEVAKGRNLSQNIVLKPGDTVVVP